MAHMGSLEFEAFPVEIRLKIYRELLIAEDEEMLDPTEMRGNPTGLHPQILACNRKIQDEAATVLYGENCFTWTVVGLYPLELWHGFETEKTVISRRYSRLITRMHISVSFRGDDGDISGPAIQKAHDQTLANMENVCEKLRLNDLKYLEVYYINSYTGGPCAAMLGGGNLLGNPYEGQTCLLPLLSVRATQVSPPCLATQRRPWVMMSNSSRLIIMPLQPSQHV